jgi:GNAT superfamily N-acetyltransferase
MEAPERTVQSLDKLTITDMEPVPERVLGLRKELNLLWYGPSRVLLARDDASEIVGAVRLAPRQDAWRRHGLIADLQVDPDWRNQGIEERLIQQAEAALRAQGVTKIDALIADGQGLAAYYYRLGYWPSRKTVVVGWDLSGVDPPPENAEFTIERLDRPQVDPVADLVLASYQPYWQWWKEQKEDKKWFRAEFPAEPEQPDSADLAAEMRARVCAAAGEIAERRDHVLFVARCDGRPVGLCDARAGTGPDDDNFSFGVLVLRDFGGKRLGSALLGHALHWLRTQGLSQARITTTSGLDDYDPTVYLYNLAFQGQILGEYVDLVKRKWD